MEPLLLPPARYQLTTWRWHVLVLFALSNCNQCLAWFSFSSISQATAAAYFGEAMDKNELDLLLNWGPIIGVFFFPVQTWILQQPRGLQRGIWLGMALNLAGNLITRLENVHGLGSLTELNLRRNKLSAVAEVPPLRGACQLSGAPACQLSGAPVQHTACTRARAAAGAGGR